MRTYGVGLCALAALASALLLVPGASAATGGPDWGGYTYVDSDEPNGPEAAPAWNLISGTDITDGVACDASVVVALPFSFDFYGTTYDSLWVNENGWFTFEEPPTDTGYGSSVVQAEPIPSTLVPNQVIAGLFADLDVTGTAEIPLCLPDSPLASGSVQHGMDGPDYVFQWLDVPTFNDCIGTCSTAEAAAVSLQIRLREATTPGIANHIHVVFIEAAYQPFGSGSSEGINANTATLVGIEEDGSTTDGDHGLSFLYQPITSDTPVDLTGRTVRFFRNAAPVAITPETIVTLDEDCSPTASATPCATPVAFDMTGTDPDGDSLLFCIVSPPAQGTLGPAIPPCPMTMPPAVAPLAGVSSLAASYTPNQDACNDPASGVPYDTLVFQATDGLLFSEDATIQFAIDCVNDAPMTLTPHLLTVGQDSGPTSFNIPGFDVDVAMISDTLYWCIEGGPANGVTAGFTTCPAFGTGTGTYVPNTGYCNTDGGAADTFGFKVIDAAGLEVSGTVEVRVTCPGAPPPPPWQNQRPTAFFGMAPSPARVGGVVVFQDASTDPDPGDTIMAWHWSFGDGSVSQERNPRHVFGSTGVFQVCLRVVDLYGEWSKAHCRTLQVVPAAEGQAPSPSPPAPTESSQGGGTSGKAARKLSVTIDGPTTAAPGDQVTLVAHADGSPATVFAWQQLAGEAVLTVSGASVTFTVPTDAESLFFAVTATDGADEGTLTRLIAVDEAAEAVVARITGPVSGLAGQTVALDASTSQGATSFHWVQVSGPAVTMQGANTARPLVHLGEAGTVMLMVAADNGQGATTATHTIVVAAAPGTVTGDSGNEGPARSSGVDADARSESSDGAAEASAHEKTMAGLGMPVWLPYAIVAFVSAFLAVGATLLLRRRA